MLSKKESKSEIVVIGAGVAGLAAAAELAESGYLVTVLEARERIGGRVFTVRDQHWQFPIELGAEFIHGKPDQILKPLRKNKVPLTEVGGDSWCVRKGKICACDFFGEVDDVLQRMDDRKADESFASFLKDSCADVPEETKRHAINYVSGFNAADPAKVSVHWLVQQMRAEEKSGGGDKAFRASHGYGSLLEIFRRQLLVKNVTIHSGTIVERITWRRNSVSIEARGGTKGKIFHAKRALITLPIGVLQARAGAVGAVEFRPRLPEEKLNALCGIEMGHVVRVALSFRERFWEQIKPGGGKKTMADLSFLFSDDEFFPTWWTMSPEQLPIIIGWSAAACADRVVERGLSIENRALKTLGKLLGIKQRRLQSLLAEAHFHDWQSDPFSRGAYSYVKAGGFDAPKMLGAPVEDTLFFAGEATDDSGNTGTVHGAIASGSRAASEIRKARKKTS